MNSAADIHFVLSSFVRPLSPQVSVPGASAQKSIVNLVGIALL